MSIKLVFLLVSAFLAVQQASARTSMLSLLAPALAGDDSSSVELMNPVEKLPETIFDISRTIRSILYVPIRLILGVLRVILFPVRLIVRVIAYPFRRIFYMLRILFYPITRIVRLILGALWRLLTAIPVIRIPALAAYYIYRIVSVPLRIIRRIARRILF